MWEITITHEGLHAYRTIRGATKQEAETKARLQRDAWDFRWARLIQKDAERKKRLIQQHWWEKRSDIDRRSKAAALDATKEAEAAIKGLHELLSNALAKSPSLNWESLKDTSEFKKLEEPPPKIEPLPPEPLITESHFVTLPVTPTLTFIDWILPGARQKKLATARIEEDNRKRDAQERFARVHTAWEQQVREITERNRAALAKHEKKKVARLLEKRNFQEVQRLFNSEIDAFRKSYFERAPAALVRYWTEVLSRSEYPDPFPRDEVFSFDSETGMLVVDYELPSQKALPNIKRVKYVTSREEFQEKLPRA